MEFKTFYYGCDGVKDHGWGCSYRNLQTILSAYGRNTTIPTIDELLMYFRNKNVVRHNMIVPSLWIEPQHIRMYLQEKHKFSGQHVLVAPMGLASASKYLLKTKVDDFDVTYYNTKLLMDEIHNYFEKETLPIVIDNGIYSYCIHRRGDGYVLIDPHVEGENHVREIDVLKFLGNETWMVYLPKCQNS